MPKEKNHYDDIAFIFFAISILGLILIPTTISYLRKWKKAFSEVYTGDCGCDACRRKAKAQQKENRKPSRFAYFKFGLYLLVWATILYLTYVAYHIQTEMPVFFDPYKILEVDTGATEAQIKSSFRKLTLKYHPDKNDSPDAPQLYADVVKAHKTLTDAETREKWEMYGNPDGPQGITVGVALPEWLVDGKNKSVVLAVYLIFLVVVVPTVAVCFWNSQREKAHNQLNNKTMAHFFQSLRENHRFRFLIDIWTLSFEYVQSIPVRRSDEAELIALKEQLPSDEKMNAQIRKNLKADKNNQQGAGMHPLRIKNPMLLFIYMSRLGNKLSPLMRSDLDLFIKQAYRHIFGVVEISVARQWLVPTIESVHISQMVVQAVWGESARMGKVSDLLQLPHFDEKTLAKASDKGMKTSTIKAFLAASEEKRENFLKENFSPEQISDIKKAITKFPSDVTFSSVKSTNEEEEEETKITANSVVTVTVTISRPSITGLDKDTPVDVHAPWYPLEKKESWWAILGDDRTGLVIAWKKIPALHDGTEAKLQYQAPKKPGVYNFTLYLLNDSYVGFDLTSPYRVDVGKEAVYVPPPVEEYDSEGEAVSEEDMSESDTDSEDEK